MKKKFFGIIGLITIIAFMSLACGSSGSSSGGNPPGGEVSVQGSTLKAKMDWIKDNAKSDTTYIVEVLDDVEVNDATYPPDYNESNGKFYMVLGDYVGKTGIIIRFTGGKSINLKSIGILFVVGPGVTVILDNITLQGINNNNEALVQTANGGAIIMNDGATIKDNTHAGTKNNGGGVDVRGGGTFTMNGGTISGNTAAGSGGGVYVNSGTFTMKGNAIISGNTAGTKGGGVSVRTNPDKGVGIFIMEGGTIYGSNDPDRQNTITGGAASSLSVEDSNGGARARYGNGDNII